jgi:hypothetical protein
MKVHTTNKWFLSRVGDKIGKSIEVRPAKEPRKIGWLARLVRRWRVCPKQAEINRLRRVLHDIADSRPDQYMDIEKTPQLTTWICETCRKASVGAYPSNAKRIDPLTQDSETP